MPKFAVFLHINGPFREDADSWFDGAYTHRVVVSETESGAAQAAVNALRSEPQFVQFNTGPEGSQPWVEVEKVRRAKWYEGLRGKPGIVFYSESDNRFEQE